MSTPINDGGPAFPTKREYQHGAGTGYEHIEGMSPRDWFAGQALQAIIGLGNDYAYKGGGKVKDAAAADAYALADAMIAARSAKTEDDK